MAEHQIRASMLRSLPRYDGHSSWRLHETSLEMWRELNPVAQTPVAWQKNAILFSLSGNASERATVIGVGTEAFNGAATWQAMIALVRNLFQPAADSEISRIAFRSRKQAAQEDVGSYLTAKVALWRGAYPEAAARNFDVLLDEAINGLFNKVIKRMVRRTNPRTEQALMETATSAVASERYAYTGGYSESTSLDGLTTVIETAHRRSYPTRQDDVEPMEVDAIEKGKETRKCYNCGIPGHLAKDCRKPKKKREDRGKNSRKCYNCGTAGHFAKDCRKPKRKKKEEVKAVEEEMNTEPDVFEEEED